MKLTTFDKSIAAFVVAFVGALVSEVNTGDSFGIKTFLLALGTAVVTSGAVFSAQNKGE